MSQIDFIRSTVNDFFDELVGEGIADSGTYFAVGADDGVACRGLVKRGAAEVGGGIGRLTGAHVVIRLVLGDLVDAPPQADGIFSVTSEAFGTENFRLLKLIADNGAIADWSAEKRRG